MGDLGQGRRFASWRRSCPTSDVHPPQLPPSCCPRGRPHGKSYYLFTVCATSSRFLPALPLPNPPFCSETTFPFPPAVPAMSSLGAGTQTDVGVEAQDMLGGARFLPLRTQGPSKALRAGCGLVGGGWHKGVHVCVSR